MRLRPGLTLAALLITTPLAAQSAKHPAEDAFAAAVSEPGLQRMVRELVALGPRMGGTPSGDNAAEYRRAYFQKLRLPVIVADDPAVLAHWESSWTLSIAPGGRLESAWPLGYSPPVAVGARGKILFVKDLAAVVPAPEWAGAVLYTPGPVGRAYQAIAKSPHRPIAIVTSAPHQAGKYMEAARLSALAAREDNPIAAFAVGYLDGETLRAAAARGLQADVALVSNTRKAPVKTVAATIAGADPSKYWLICAHGDSDSGGPGADDNASGEATVMEIARVMKALADTGQFKPKHSIKFVIWGSEYHSARAWIEREGPALSALQGVLNFDETGTGAEREAIYFESNDVPWNKTLLGTLAAVGADYVGKPGFWPEYATNPSQGGTDSYAFLPKQYKGTDYTKLQIPSTTVYTAAWDQLAVLDQTEGWDVPGQPGSRKLEIDYSAYYHSSGDTPANTTDREPQNMVRAVKAVGIAMLRLTR
ncbi:MAG: M28 family peptidase [Acidobacteriota bacterium]|nr:M28 family peptidase [Acidobacteriota bacterium]